MSRIVLRTVKDFVRGTETVDYWTDEPDGVVTRVTELRPLGRASISTERQIMNFWRKHPELSTVTTYHAFYRDSTGEHP